MTVPGSGWALPQYPCLSIYQKKIKRIEDTQGIRKVGKYVSAAAGVGLGMIAVKNIDVIESENENAKYLSGGLMGALFGYAAYGAIDQAFEIISAYRFLGFDLVAEPEDSSNVSPEPIEQTDFIEQTTAEFNLSVQQVKYIMKQLTESTDLACRVAHLNKIRGLKAQPIRRVMARYRLAIQATLLP